MKIVQSFWMKPLIDPDGNINAGHWLDGRYNAISWALSCLQFRKYYDEVELVTDEMGKMYLIDYLQLPYTSVRVELDELNDQHDSSLFMVGKLKAYSLQDKPFWHVDGDVIIFEPFPQEMEQAGLVAQNIEYDKPFYQDTLALLDKEFKWFPEAYLRAKQFPGRASAYNAGLFGGTDIAFFKEYIAEAERFLEKNKGLSFSQPLWQFGTVVEQHLFYCMALQQEKSVYTYLPEGSFERIDINNIGPGNTYFHPVAVYKRDENYCKGIERILKEQYPYHYAIVDEVVRSAA